MSKYKVNYYPGCVMFKHVTCFWMCVLFYVSSVCLHVCAYAFKLKVHCGSTLEPGASKLPHYCTTPVSVPDVIGSKTTKQKKLARKKVHFESAFEPGASGLPYYCTSSFFLSFCSLRARCVATKPKKKTKRLK